MIHYTGFARRVERPCPSNDDDSTTEKISDVTCRRCLLNIANGQRPPFSGADIRVEAWDWIFFRQDEEIDRLRSEVARLAGALAARDFDPRPMPPFDATTQRWLDVSSLAEIPSNVVFVIDDEQVAAAERNERPNYTFIVIAKILRGILDRLEGKV